MEEKESTRGIIPMRDENGKINYLTIRTSDRRTFRRCLRKWNLTSPLKHNLQRAGSEQNIHLWFGSGIHFAMEDAHGYNYFKDPRAAFEAYYQAFKPEELPEGAEEHLELGLGMLTYYMDWFPKKNQSMGLRTLWVDNQKREAIPGAPGSRPCVEFPFLLDLGVRIMIDAEKQSVIAIHRKEYDTNTPGGPLPSFYQLDRQIGSLPPGTYFQQTSDATPIPAYIVPLCYHGTIDNIAVDGYGRWWIIDYKTAKSADTNKLDTDDQISAYLWGVEQYLQHPIHGFIYLQLTKDVPHPPRELKNQTLSLDKRQKTTHALFRQELINRFGDVSKAPNDHIEFLNYLAEQETPEGDKFIRWDMVLRNDAQKASTYHHILGEVQLMLDKGLYMFPNPTRDCMWDCPVRDVCLAMDAGLKDDVTHILATDFEQRPIQEGHFDDWRDRIKWPEGVKPRPEIQQSLDPQATEKARTLAESILQENQFFNLTGGGK